MRQRVASWRKTSWRNLAGKGAHYWAGFAIVLAFGLHLAGVAEDSTASLGVRYWVHDQLTGLWPFERVSGHTLVISVENDEYYGTENRAMSPLSPRLIAECLLKAEAAGATTIAIDFDTRYADPQQPSLLGEEFDAKVLELANAIAAVARKIPVILPAMLDRAGTALEGSYLDSLIGHPNVRLGLVNLPSDVRYIPLGAFDAKTGRFVEGLGVALARSKLARSEIAALLPNREIRSPMIAFQRPIEEMSAHELLHGDFAVVRQKVSGRLLILAGRWTTPTRFDSRIVDVYDSPAGRLPGALIHAHYAEAALSGELYMPAPAVVMTTFKLIVLLLVGVAMALLRSLRDKIASVVASLVVHLAFGYFVFINAGMSFDVAIPALFILMHAAVDHVQSWHDRAEGGAPC